MSGKKIAKYRVYYQNRDSPSDIWSLVSPKGDLIQTEVLEQIDVARLFNRFIEKRDDSLIAVLESVLTDSSFSWSLEENMYYLVVQFYFVACLAIINSKVEQTIITRTF